ncbi:MAG: HAMP domain-containing histidine kinase, partial [Candidatus Dormibacteraeota bacterium]|nr:HAMP domain-containing histidine kinase [Candidatus Dormibacteraeota bacterium]
MRLRRDSPLWAAARVAAVATAIAAVLYAVAAFGIVVLVLSTLTQRVDGALADQLRYFQDRPLAAVNRAQGVAGVGNGPRDPFSASALWIVYPDGQVRASPTSPPLPDRYRRVEAPTAVTIQGYGYRLVGGPLGSGWLILGTSSAYIDFTARALIFELLVVAIPVLVLVFLSALAIGRWSAAPIDRARRRLLEFTADASHELRTPLQVIEAEVSLALLVQRSAPSYRETIENISRESRRLRHLVDDLLWLARFDNLPGRPRAEEVDVGQLAGDAVERFRAPAEQKHQRLSLEAGRAGQALVVAPPDWIDRLLGVLLDNACRYTPEGGSIRVAVEPRDGQVTLRVEDSGPGIPADQRQRVFERFHRLNED